MKSPRRKFKRHAPSLEESMANLGIPEDYPWDAPAADTAAHPALGIDYGEARIGIAATDACGILPHPVESIPRQKVNPLERIAELVQQLGIRTLVLGYPLRLDGSEGSACEKVRAFGDTLRARLPELPLVYVDEFLTTTVAQQKLHAAGKKSRDFRPIIDQAAAVEILNNWLRSTAPTA